MNRKPGKGIYVSGQKPLGFGPRKYYDYSSGLRGHVRSGAPRGREFSEEAPAPGLALVRQSRALGRTQSLAGRHRPAISDAGEAEPQSELKARRGILMRPCIKRKSNKKLWGCSSMTESHLESAETWPNYRTTERGDFQEV